MSMPSHEISYRASPKALQAMQAQFDSSDAAVDDETQSTLIQGLIAGQNPRDVALQLVNDAMNASQALTFARDTMLGSYRDAAQETYQQNSDVVSGWMWCADQSANTCAACLFMDGTTFDVDETMDTHANCRCAMIPVTKSWDDILGPLGIDASDIPETSITEDYRSGAEWFYASDEATQLAILGPAAFNAWRAGDLDPGRLAAFDESGRLYQRSLKSLGIDFRDYLGRFNRADKEVAPFVEPIPEHLRVAVTIDDEVRASLATMLGRDTLTDEQIAGLVGARPGDAVEVHGQTGGTYFELRLHGTSVMTADGEEGYFALRSIFRDSKSGSLVMYNASFNVDEALQGRGIGLEVFSGQVDGARALGVDEIGTTASGGGTGFGFTTGDANGAWVWARFGYNGPIPWEDMFANGLKPEDVPEGLRGARTIQGLMRREGGPEFWKEWNYTFDGVFNLHDGSVSMQVLQDYRDARVAAQAATTTAERGVDAGLGRTLDISPQFQAYLERQLGYAIDPADLADLVGAQEGATIHNVGTEIVIEGQDGSYVHTVHILGADDEVPLLRLQNNTFEVAGDPYAPFPAEILERQASVAHDLGIDLITTKARDPLSQDYWLLPQMGYDARINANFIAELRSKVLPDEYAQYERLSQILQTPEGRAWWQAEGKTLGLEFDPTPGSWSMRQLDRYIEESTGFEARAAAGLSAEERAAAKAEKAAAKADQSVTRAEGKVAKAETVAEKAEAKATAAEGAKLDAAQAKVESAQAKLDKAEAKVKAMDAKAASGAKLPATFDTQYEKAQAAVDSARTALQKAEDGLANASKAAQDARKAADAAQETLATAQKALADAREAAQSARAAADAARGATTTVAKPSAQVAERTVPVATEARSLGTAQDIRDRQQAMTDFFHDAIVNENNYTIPDALVDDPAFGRTADKWLVGPNRVDAEQIERQAEWNRMQGVYPDTPEAIRRDLTYQSIIEEYHTPAGGGSFTARQMQIALQEAARREFGLEGAVSFYDDAAAARAVRRYGQEGIQGLQNMLRAMYDETQAYFREQGITEVQVFRGMRWAEGAQPEGVVFDGAAHAAAFGLQPLSSVSTDLETALEYANGVGYVGHAQDYRAVVADVIPVERVIGIPYSGGFSAPSMYEMVILGGDQPATVLAWTGSELGDLTPEQVIERIASDAAQTAATAERAAARVATDEAQPGDKLVIVQHIDAKRVGPDQHGGKLLAAIHEAYGDRQLGAALSYYGQDELKQMASDLGIQAGRTKAETISRIVEKVTQGRYRADFETVAKEVTPRAAPTAPAAPAAPKAVKPTKADLAADDLRAQARAWQDAHPEAPREAQPGDHLETVADVNAKRFGPDQHGQALLGAIHEAYGDAQLGAVLAPFPRSTLAEMASDLGLPTPRNKWTLLSTLVSSVTDGRYAADFDAAARAAEGLAAEGGSAAGGAAGDAALHAQVERLSSDATTQEAEAWLVAQLPGAEVAIDALNDDVAALAANVIANLMDALPQVAANIQRIEAEAQTLGFSTRALALVNKEGTVLRLNPVQWFSLEDMAAKAQAGFDDGWMTTATPEGIIGHEFGHLVQINYGITNDEWTAAMARAAAFGGNPVVSLYGSTTLEEGFAETFALLIYGTPTPAQLPIVQEMAQLLADHGLDYNAIRAAVGSPPLDLGR